MKLLLLLTFKQKSLVQFLIYWCEKNIWCEFLNGQFGISYPARNFYQREKMKLSFLATASAFYAKEGCPLVFNKINGFKMFMSNKKGFSVIQKNKKNVIMHALINFSAVWAPVQNLRVSQRVTENFSHALILVLVMPVVQMDVRSVFLWKLFYCNFSF